MSTRSLIDINEIYGDAEKLWLAENFERVRTIIANRGKTLPSEICPHGNPAGAKGCIACTFPLKAGEIPAICTCSATYGRSRCELYKQQQETRSEICDDEIFDALWNAVMDMPSEIRMRLSIHDIREILSVVEKTLRPYLGIAEPGKCPDCGADMMEVCSGLEDVCKREPVSKEIPVVKDERYKRGFDDGYDAAKTEPVSKGDKNE